MEHIEIVFEDLAESQTEMLTAMLSAIGFAGFQEEENLFKAYVPANEIDRIGFDELIKQNGITYSESLIKEKNWNEKWETDFQPVAVINPVTNARFAFIRAGFHEKNPAYQYDILVTPKMSFGTGHHATTYLMVQQMSQLEFRNKAVIDFGTGTGILAIVAEKAGANAILAIDCDDWSINNAKENVAMNSCTRIEIIKGETIPAASKADIILANINLNIILANLRQIKAAVKENGKILLSGILLSDEQTIIEQLKNEGFLIKEVFHRDNWIAILAEVTPHPW